MANCSPPPADFPRAKAKSKSGTSRRSTVTATITGHSDCIYAVAFSPDGATLATASYDKLIKLWDAATGKEIRTLQDHIDAVYALAFTPDGKRLVSGAADRSVKVWDVATGARLYTLSEPTDGINTIALSPDGNARGRRRARQDHPHLGARRERRHAAKIPSSRTRTPS